MTENNQVVRPVPLDAYEIFYAWKLAIEQFRDAEARVYLSQLERLANCPKKDDATRLA